jgi:Ca2+:H+ antiporter
MVGKQKKSITNIVGPLLAALFVAIYWKNPPNSVEVFVISIVLVGAVITAVHHAEIISAYVGRSLGALILALSVTIIEVGLIVAIMLSSDGSAATLGRDTVFSAIMITCNGMIGLSVVAASIKEAAPTFNSEGSGATLSAIATIATLSLVLPAFTLSSSGPTFTRPQLFFVAIVSLAVYALFLYVLTVRNREHFEDPENLVVVPYAYVPSKKVFKQSVTLLLITLSGKTNLPRLGGDPTLDMGQTLAIHIEMKSDSLQWKIGVGALLLFVLFLGLCGFTPGA